MYIRRMADEHVIGQSQLSVERQCKFNTGHCRSSLHTLAQLVHNLWNKGLLRLIPFAKLRLKYPSFDKKVVLTKGSPHIYSPQSIPYNILNPGILPRLQHQKRSAWGM